MMGKITFTALFIAALSLASFPAARIGCLYWGFDWPSSADFNITQLDVDLTIVNDLDTNICLYYATELNCGTQSSQTHFYFGLQTNLQGRGKGLLFSRWDTTDSSNAKGAGTPDSWVEVGTYEGNFVGVRRLYNWTNHHYILRLTSLPEEDDEIGRWFHFTLVDTETGEETYVGGLRFFKDSSGRYPTVLTQGYGCWIEQPVPVSAPEDVPQWTIGIGRPSANNHELWATRSSWWFAPVSDNEPWQNNDIWAEDETIYGKIGNGTVRTHGDTGNHVYCQNVSIGASPSTLPNGLVGFSYHEVLNATGGVAPYSFALSSGSLPPGLTLAESGEFEGTPTTGGNYSFDVAITDSRGCSGTVSFSIMIAEPPAISSIVKLGNPFRLRITGSGFQSDAKVYIGEGGTEWTNKKFKSAGEILLKGGTSLKNLFPKDVQVEIEVVNGDGGSAAYFYMR